MWAKVLKKSDTALKPHHFFTYLGYFRELLYALTTDIEVAYVKSTILDYLNRNVNIKVIVSVNVFYSSSFCNLYCN